MSEMIILNVEPYGFSQTAEIAWRKIGNYHTTTWNEVQDDVKALTSVLIVRLSKVISKEVLDQFPSLKVIVTATTGLDHIDLLETEKKGVAVISLRGEDDFLKSIPSTAEHTWALLMSLVRNIPVANADVREGFWQRDKFRGHQLASKTLGIIGLGRTGFRVARYAQAFQMNVIYFDPFVDSKEFIRCQSLTDLVSQSEIFSIHVHLTSETTGMMNGDIWSRIKKDSFFINTSRGKLVDEHALVRALENGVLTGVASDVVESELDNIKNSPLFKSFLKGYNIILTPHLGGATWEAMHACEEFMVQKFLKVAPL